MPHHQTIFDATFINADTNPVNGILWPAALPGSLRSLMMGNILCTDGSPISAQRILEVADGCKNGTGFINYATGKTLNYGPRKFDLICLDIEIKGQDTLPATMLSLVKPVVDAGYQVAVYIPAQLFGYDDSPLKQLNWDGKIPDGALEWARANESWIGLLWGVGCGAYFGHPINDESTLILIRNQAYLAKQLWNGRRVATVCAQRDTSAYAPGTVISTALCERLSGLLRAVGVDVQVWGQRSQQLYLMKCLGVG